MDLVLKKVDGWWQAVLEGQKLSKVFKTKAELVDHYTNHIVITTEEEGITIDPEDDIFTKILKVAIKSGYDIYWSKPQGIKVIGEYLYEITFTKHIRILSMNDLLTGDGWIIQFLLEKDWLLSGSYTVSDKLGTFGAIADRKLYATRAIILFVRLYCDDERVDFLQEVYCWPLKF